MSLQNRFKELRRTPTKRKESSSIQKEVIKKPMILNKVELFPGEDDVSHERHTKTLKAEYKKTKRNHVEDIPKKKEWHEKSISNPRNYF